MSAIPKTRRRWLRFSLRGLLLLVTIAGIGMMFVVRWHQRAMRQRAAVAALGQNAVEYEEWFDPDEPPPVPQWLRGLVGYDHLYQVVGVTLEDATDHQMKLLNDFPQLERLNLDSASRCTEAGFYQLRSHMNLQDLHVSDSPELNDQALISIASISGLQTLDLECSNNAGQSSVGRSVQ